MPINTVPFQLLGGNMDGLLPVIYDQSNGATVVKILSRMISLTDMRFSDSEYRDLQHLANQCSERNSIFQLDESEVRKLIHLIGQYLPELLMDSRLDPFETLLHPELDDAAVNFARQYYEQAYATYLESVSIHWSQFKIERYFLWKGVERSRIPKPISSALGMILYQVDFILDAASMARELVRLFSEYGKDRELFVARLTTGHDDNHFVMEFVKQHAD